MAAGCLLGYAVEPSLVALVTKCFKVVEMLGQEALEHLGFFFIGAKIALIDPLVPTLKELLASLYSECPVLEIVLSLPGLSCFQIRFFEEVEALQVSIIEIFFFEEPHLPVALVHQFLRD